MKHTRNISKLEFTLWTIIKLVLLSEKTSELAASLLSISSACEVTWLILSPSGDSGVAPVSQAPSSHWHRAAGNENAVFLHSQ